MVRLKVASFLTLPIFRVMKVTLGRMPALSVLLKRLLGMFIGLPFGGHKGCYTQANIPDQFGKCLVFKERSKNRYHGAVL